MVLVNSIKNFPCYFYVKVLFYYRRTKVQVNSPELALAPSRSQERGEARVDLLIGTVAVNMCLPGLSVSSTARGDRPL